MGYGLTIECLNQIRVFVDKLSKLGGILASSNELVHSQVVVMGSAMMRGARVWVWVWVFGMLGLLVRVVGMLKHITEVEVLDGCLCRVKPVINQYTFVVHPKQQLKLANEEL